MKCIKYLILTSLSVVYAACGGISDGKVEGLIAQTPRFAEPVYAPFTVGEITIPRNERENPKPYIDKQFGELVTAGMITVSEPIEKSWKSVVRVGLTVEGEKLAATADSLSSRRQRSVQTCRYALSKIVSLTENEGKTEAQCIYQYKTTDITPFGKFFKVRSGTSFTDTVRLAKTDAGEWNIIK